MEANQTTDPTGYTTIAAFDAQPPGGYCQPEMRLKAFRAALADVDLGSYDIKIIHWLLGWDDATCRTVVSLLWRTRRAGEAAGPPGIAAQLASLASWIDDRLGDETADRQIVAEDAAAQLRDLAGVLRAVRGEAAVPGPVTLTAGQAGTVRQALADATAYRTDRAGGGCKDCDAAPDGACADHVADVDRAQEYERLTRALLAGEGQGGGEDQDEDQPYCTVCNSEVGIFRGHGDGWHHYRGDGTAGAPVELYDAGHAPAVARRPVEGEAGRGN